MQISTTVPKTTVAAKLVLWTKFKKNIRVKRKLKTFAELEWRLKKAALNLKMC